jgi:hypothetical protein
MDEFRIHLDADFVIAITKDLHLVDGRNAHQLISNLKSDLFSRIFIERAIDRQKHDMNRHFLLVDDRFLSETRKRGDSVDLRFDLGENFIDIFASRHLDRYTAQSFTGARIDFNDAWDVLNRFLNLDNNAFLHLLWSGAEIRYPYLDHVQLKIGRRLFADGKCGNNSKRDYQKHKQVRRNMVVCKPRNDSLL